LQIIAFGTLSEARAGTAGVLACLPREPHLISKATLAIS